MTTTVTNPRRHLPDRRKSVTHKLRLAGQSVFLTIGHYETGEPGEIFVVLSKAGSTLRTMTDCWAKGVSYALQFGTPLAVLVDGYLWTQCPPDGEVSGHPDVVKAYSIPDLIVRVLAIEYLGRRDLANAPVLPESAVGLETVVDVPNPLKVQRLHPTAEEVAAKQAEDGQHEDAYRARQQGYTGAVCDICHGSKMRQSGTCTVCETCGATGGCS